MIKSVNDSFSDNYFKKWNDYRFKQEIHFIFKFQEPEAGIFVNLSLITYTGMYFALYFNKVKMP